MRFSSGLVLSLSWLAQAAVLPNVAHSTDLQTRAGSGLKSMTFFVDWAIYARSYMPDDLIPNHFTHVFYAFLDIKPSGEVVLADPYADISKHFPGDSWTDPGNNVYGCVKQLYEIKQKNRHMNTLLSIGGWTYRHKFAGPASTASGRKTFATSAVNHLKNLGFDGIDVDWEYPANDAEAGDLVELLKEIRTELDNYEAEVGDDKKYLLTVDSSAGPQHYNYYHFKDMDKYIDFWNLMAFDYAGGTFSNGTGYLANVYKSDTNPDATPFATDPAIKDYIAGGVPPEKIVLGMPLYGRSFANTQGMGEPFDGAGKGTWEDGNWDYSELPHPGATVHNDMDIIGSYGYDSNKDFLISFDTPQVQAKKADYITSNNLGGGWWWESSSDKTGADSLVQTVIDQWGGTGVFEQRENQLNFPQSKYDNIKNRMGNGNPPSSSSTTTSSSPTSTTSTTTKSEPSSTPTGETVPHWGQCGGKGYDGPTTCTPPYTCVKQSEWWSSCQ